MKALQLLIGALAMLGISEMSAQTGTIQGKVLDDMGKPLAWVYVYVSNGTSQVNTSTDSLGKYTLKPLNPGKYDVTYNMMTFKTTVISGINVTSNKISFANVDMEFDNTMGEFVVEDKKVIKWKRPLIRVDEPTVEEMTTKEINMSPNRNDTKALITSTLPGATLDPATGGISVRGARPINTLYFVDGVKSMDGALDVPGMAIGNVKVYTGGVPAKYGDVTGGVVIIETKSYFDLVTK